MTLAREVRVAGMVRNVHCLSLCYRRKMAARCYLKLGWHLTLTKKSTVEAIGEKDANLHDVKVSTDTRDNFLS